MTRADFLEELDKRNVLAIDASLPCSYISALFINALYFTG